MRRKMKRRGQKPSLLSQSGVVKSPLLMQSNPVHKMYPVLIHNGKAVCESLIALRYIDKVWSDKALLLPSDPYLRSQAKFRADFVDKKIYDLGKKILTTEGGEQKAAQKEFIERVKLLEVELGDKHFFGGESLGFVDIALLQLYSGFSVYEKFCNFNIEPECPKFFAWAKRCLEKQSMSKSLPDKEMVYQGIVQWKKMLGGN